MTNGPFVCAKSAADHPRQEEAPQDLQQVSREDLDYVPSSDLKPVHVSPVLGQMSSPTGAYDVPQSTVPQARGLFRQSREQNM